MGRMQSRLSGCHSNTTYYIAVTDADGAEGNFDLCVTLLNISAPYHFSKSHNYWSKSKVLH
jgi:hypothetical protein